MKRYALPTLFLLAFIVLPAITIAQTGGGGTQSTGGGGTQSTGGGGTTVVSTNPNGYEVKNPLGVNSACGLVKKILQAAIQIGIPIAVLFIVYAGFKFVLARGSPEKLKEARSNFLWTIIGIAIFLGAWLLATVVANTVNQLGGSQNIISCQ